MCFLIFLDFFSTLLLSSLDDLLLPLLLEDDDEDDGDLVRLIVSKFDSPVAGTRVGIVVGYFYSSAGFAGSDEGIVGLGGSAGFGAAALTSPQFEITTRLKGLSPA